MKKAFWHGGFSVALAVVILVGFASVSTATNFKASTSIVGTTQAQGSDGRGNYSAITHTGTFVCDLYASSSGPTIDSGFEGFVAECTTPSGDLAIAYLDQGRLIVTYNSKGKKSNTASFTGKAAGTVYRWIDTDWYEVGFAYLNNCTGKLNIVSATRVISSVSLTCEFHYGDEDYGEIGSGKFTNVVLKPY